ncbi:MaoC family dehydratase [Wenyingzhuangia marina]|uniref:Acyl dehydratase n=1 Tax=Wenyingzhuangia marina TaxID=1195760 RepID=A0A1M5V1Q2_9FLAO|nr:MaoC family dehydratase [Wenyingzhuangia marina]GGF74983.1 acyl dehydratase [Wenyingzhuangia marina]SHH69227.1 Acyl dehydratase [Wenyingzhuangia marina]
MAKVIINSFEDFKAYEGKEIGISEYLAIPQERINQFADATLDHQWIHCDAEKAKEGPFGTPIAHGYLTLSLMPYLWEQIIEVNNSKMLVNYGIEKLKFNKPVPVDAKVRLRTKLKSIDNLRGISKAVLSINIEIEGERKTALDADIVFLYHFVN